MTSTALDLQFNKHRSNFFRCNSTSIRKLCLFISSKFFSLIISLNLQNKFLFRFTKSTQFYKFNEYNSGYYQPSYYF